MNKTLKSLQLTNANEAKFGPNMVKALISANLL